MVEIIILCAAVASVVFGITLLIKSGPKKEEVATKEPEVKLPGVKPLISQTVEVQAKKQVKPKITSTSKNTAKPAALAKMEAKPKQTKNKK
jgi:hypothetical protein